MDIDAEYPNPLADHEVKRIIEQRMHMGWDPPQDPETQARIRHRIRIQARLRRWMHEMGVDRGKGLHPSHPDYKPPEL